MCIYGVFIFSLNICGLLKAIILYQRYSKVYFEIIIRHAWQYRWRHTTPHLVYSSLVLPFFLKLNKTCEKNYLYMPLRSSTFINIFLWFFLFLTHNSYTTKSGRLAHCCCYYSIIWGWSVVLLVLIRWFSNLLKHTI